MTTSEQYRDDQRFDSDAGVEDDSEGNMGGRALSAVLAITYQLRRVVVFVPIFGVIYLGLGVLWFQGVQAEHSLKSDSDSLRVLLDQPAPQPDPLLKEAASWDAAYQVAFDKRTARPADSDLVGSVIFAAQVSGLLVVETGTTDDGTATLENDKYTVTPLLIKVNGTIDGVGRFLEYLETDDFKAFEVQSTILTAEEVGYILTLRGVYYSLPENFGEEIENSDEAGLVIPIIPVDLADEGEVTP